MTDSTNITRLIKEIKPDEICNLAAMSHVHVSFETPEYTGKEAFYYGCHDAAEGLYIGLRAGSR